MQPAVAGTFTFGTNEEKSMQNTCKLNGNFNDYKAMSSAPSGTHIVSFTHNVRFSVKGLAFHTHCWRKLTLPYLAEVQQIPTSPNCPNIEQTCLNLLKRLTNAPYVQPFIIHDVACTLKRKENPFLMQR